MSYRRVVFSAAVVVGLVGASVAVGTWASADIPDAPVITTVGDSVADTTPVLIQGNAENPNGVDQLVEVHVVVDGIDEVYCTANIAYSDPDPTTWSCADVAPLAYGDNTFYAIQRELTPLDDFSNPSNEVTFRIGSTDPAVITSPPSGTLTHDARPTFTGTGPRLGSVVVQVQGGTPQLCTALVDAAGTWSCESDVPLSASDGTMGDTDETYQIDAVGQQVDAVVQPASPAISVTIEIPQTPVIDYYYAGTPPWQTGNAQPNMQGSMGAETVNTTVWISQDGISWGHYCNVPTPSAATTVWYCTSPTAALEPGLNYLAVSTQNAAGDQSFLSPDITVELVENPAITSVVDGSVTNDATPTFSGPAPWGTTFQIYKDSGPSPSTFLCNAPAAAGAYSCDSVPLVDGDYTVHVYSNQGIDVSSELVFFTVDTVAPDAPVITTSGSTNDTTPIVSGTGEPGATIILYRDGSPATCTNSPVVVDDGGSWSCQTATPLVPGGTYGWGATQQDAATNLSDAGVPPTQTTLTILTPPAPPPAAPALPTPTATPSPTVPPALQPQPWTFTFGTGGAEFERGDSTELTGSGLPAGALVEAEFHSTPVFLGATSVSDAGEFAIPVTIPDDATAGPHNFVVTITPAVGLPSTQSVPVTVVVHPKALGGPGSTELPFIGQASAEGSERSDPAAPSSLTHSLGTVQAVLSNPALIGGAAVAGFVLLLLVAFPAELLNSTISENYERLTRRMPRAGIPWRQRFTEWVQRTPAVGTAAMILVAAVIFGFADPNFGFDITSVRLVLACAIALFVLTYLSSSVAGAIIRRRWGWSTRIELKPLGLVLTVVGVVLSRVLEFTPGVLLGLFVGLGLVGATTAAQRAKATLVQVGVVFGFAIVGWVAYSILSAVIVPDSFATALAFDTMAAVTAEGLTALFIGLLPVKMFIGPALADYSKLLWALVYGLVATAFVLIVLPSTWGEVDGPIWTWLAVLIGFAIVALAVYLFFRFTGRDEDDDAAPAEEPARKKEKADA